MIEGSNLKCAIQLDTLWIYVAGILFVCVIYITTVCNFYKIMRMKNNISIYAI